MLREEKPVLSWNNRYCIIYSPERGGLVVAAEDRRELLALKRLKRDGVFETHLDAAAEGGCISIFVPNLGIYFPSMRFGLIKIMDLDMYMDNYLEQIDKELEEYLNNYPE